MTPVNIRWSSNVGLARSISKILGALESWGPVLFISAEILNFHLGIKKVTDTNVNLQPGFYSDFGTITPKGWKSTGTWAHERSFSVTVVPVSNAQSITMSYRGHSVTTIPSWLDLLEFQTVEIARSLRSHQTRIIYDRRMWASIPNIVFYHKKTRFTVSEVKF